MHLVVAWEFEPDAEGETEDQRRGTPKYDAQHRPKLRMRKHDWDAGFFIEIAKRHGNKAPEVKHMKALVEKTANVFFPFLQLQLPLNLE